MEERALRHILQRTDAYYTEKLKKYGPTNEGVDWNSKESQELRFAQLVKLFAGEEEFSICDYGCGYGHLCTFLREGGQLSCEYFGMDISEAMLEAARGIHERDTRAFFARGHELQGMYDYVVASGIFNVRGREDVSWKEYMMETVNMFQLHSRKGFAFNALTKYSDTDKMQDYLYYADPLFWFDYAKRNWSKNVALLHDYGLYEFTLLIRKQ